MPAFARHLLTASLLVGTPHLASAGELVHRFVNPNFGGNPLNGTFLLGGAAAQNDFKEPVVPITPRNPIDDFQRQITSRLLGLASQQIADRIYGLNPADSGAFQIGDIGINFTRIGDQTRLNIVGADGSNTEITIPTPTF